MAHARLAALILALAAAPAYATPATDAAQLESDGANLGRSGDQKGAIAKFRAAYKLDPLANYLCDQGVAYRQLNDLPRAQYYLSLCVLRGSSLRTDFVDKVRANLVAIETTLKAGNFAPFTLLTDPETATFVVDGVDADDPILAGTQIWLAFGEHKLTIKGPSRGSYKTLEVTATITSRDPVQRKEAIPVEDVAKPPPPPPNKPPPEEILVKPRAVHHHPSFVPTALTGGIGIAGLATAFVALHFASRDADRAQFAVTESVFIDDKSSVDKWNTVFGVAGAVGVVGIAAGAYFGVKYFSWSPTRGGGTATVAIRW